MHDPLKLALGMARQRIDAQQLDPTGGGGNAAADYGEAGMPGIRSRGG